MMCFPCLFCWHSTVRYRVTILVGDMGLPPKYFYHSQYHLVDKIGNLLQIRADTFRVSSTHWNKSPLNKFYHSGCAVLFTLLPTSNNTFVHDRTWSWVKTTETDLKIMISLLALWQCDLRWFWPVRQIKGDRGDKFNCHLSSGVLTGGKRRWLWTTALCYLAWSRVGHFWMFRALGLVASETGCRRSLVFLAWS